MNRHIHLALASALASVSCASAASAESLDWSYKYSGGNVISGVFTGTDAGNYFTVTGLQSFDVNGVPNNYLTGIPVLSFDSLAQVGQGYNGNGTPVVTLDGSYIDLADAPDDGTTGFFFIVGDAQAQNVGFNYTAFNLPSVADTLEPYEQARWSATLVETPVPEPSTVAIILTGVVWLAVARTRKVV